MLSQVGNTKIWSHLSDNTAAVSLNRFYRRIQLDAIQDSAG
jgi:hypothetical protein